MHSASMPRNRSKWRHAQMNECDEFAIQKRRFDTSYTQMHIYEWRFKKNSHTIYNVYSQMKTCIFTKISMYSSIVISIYLNTNLQITTKKVVCVFVDHGLCIYIVVVVLGFFDNCQFILN